MTQAAKDVLKAALALPPDERAALIDELEAAGDADPRPLPFDPAWLPEVDRRLAELDAGVSEGVPWEEVKRRSRERGRQGG